MISFIKLPSIAIVIFASTFQLFAEKNLELPTLDELKRLHIEGNLGQYSLNKLNSIFASGRVYILKMMKQSNGAFVFTRKAE